MKTGLVAIILLIVLLPCPGARGERCFVREKTALLVSTETYRQLKAEIDRYKSDVLERFPVEIEIVTGEWASPADVRSTLKQLWSVSGITGAVLVGALPMHCFFMHGFPNPNPLYYEALDARFADTHSVGHDDTCLDHPVPRIWVANIRAGEGANDDETSIRRLRDFFEKTHASYSGALKVEHRALAVTSSDWPSGAQNFFTSVGKPLFGDQGVDVLDPQQANLGNLRDMLSKHSYEMLYIQVHSTWERQDLDGGPLLAEEISGLKTGAMFVVNHGCSNSNWMRNASENHPSRNTGMSWIFGQSVGQALVGNVRTGMVYGQAALYQGLLKGDYLGKAYLAAKQSAEAEMHCGYPKGDTVSGVIFMGNPFLRIETVRESSDSMTTRRGI